MTKLDLVSVGLHLHASMAGPKMAIERRNKQLRIGWLGLVRTDCHVQGSILVSPRHTQSLSPDLSIKIPGPYQDTDVPKSPYDSQVLSSSDQILPYSSTQGRPQYIQDMWKDASTASCCWLLLSLVLSALFRRRVPIGLRLLDCTKQLRQS